LLVCCVKVESGVVLASFFFQNSFQYSSKYIYCIEEAHKVACFS